MILINHEMVSFQAYSVAGYLISLSDVINHLLPVKEALDLHAQCPTNCIDTMGVSRPHHVNVRSFSLEETEDYLMIRDK